MRIPKLSVCPYPKKRNQPGFVDISPTVVIDTSMENSSRVPTYCSTETQKFDFLFKKGQNGILTCAEVLKSP